MGLTDLRFSQVFIVLAKFEGKLCALASGSRSKKASNFFVLISLCTYVTKLKKKEKKQQARKVDKNLLFIYKRSLNIIGLFFSFKFLLFFYYIHFLSVCT